MYWEEGKSYRQIAEEFGLRGMDVKYWMRKFGIPRRGRRDGACLSVLKRITSSPRIRIPREEWKLGYLAGIIDGEGSIFLGRRCYKGKEYYYPHVSVVNTSLELIKWIMREFGVENKVHEKWHPGAYSTRRNKLVYVLKICGVSDVLTLLKALRPYLIVKRDKADEVIRYCEERIQELRKELAEVVELE
jgi:DNA-binding CsgD family transcriptional regulator